jgi:SAM-dependent methyltransferase
MTTKRSSPNPWLSVPAEEYEGHMGSPSVGQLPFLSRVFEEFLRELRPASVAVVGCATGNGFDRIDAAVTARVVGIDINPAYLEILRERYGTSLPGLELICADAASCDLPKASMDLVHCALIFEYVDAEALISRAAGWLREGGALTAVLQLPSAHGKVSAGASPAVMRLAPCIELVDPDDLGRMAEEAGFRLERSETETLESGKTFHIGLYKRTA